MSVKDFVKRAVRSFGYDIRAVHDSSGLGRDPMWDMRALVQTDRPVIFDVGANVGQSIVEFRRRFRRPIMHSFEPGPATFRELQRRVTGIPDVHLNNVGMGSRRESRVFIQNTHSDMSSFLELGAGGWGKTTERSEVTLRTIDDYCAEHGIAAIDILKTDTQGFDLEVIKGARSMMAQRKVHLVYLEIILSRMYEDLPPLDEIYRTLTEQGFSLVAFYSFYFREGRASWTDALFVHPNYVGRRGPSLRS
jgi:FkbM family methyltransferase